MKIKFLGAAGTVTGSSYALTSGSGQTILIDLGMFQGTPEIEKLNYEKYDFDCSTLFGAVLTHAHLDHCGRLPILLSGGFTGTIWMTPATRELTELSLLDSAKIAVQDNKPYLYDKDLARQTFEHFKTVTYHAPKQIGDFMMTMYDAGHILGSASLVIEDTKSDSAIRKIVFSGDLGNTPEDLLFPTEPIESADAVVMESTYGDRLHPHLDATELLQAEINAVEKSGGTLLIPAFSLEKTQELLHMIMHLKKNGKVLMKTAIFLDSPMAKNATDIYMNNTSLMNPHIQSDLKMGGPFNFSGLEITMSRDGRRSLDRHSGAKVIIAGSGMMSGGRIMGHAVQYLPRASTRLFIIGYQGEGTIGRELKEGSREIVIDGITVPVKATVTSTDGMSSHADQNQLMDWLTQIKNVKKVVLTHGEDGPRAVLAKRVAEELNLEDVAMPHLNEELTL